MDGSTTQHENVEVPHVEDLLPYLRNVWRAVNGDQVVRHRWFMRKSTDFLTFVQGFVPGIGFLAASLTLAPYVQCGGHLWRWVAMVGLAVLGILACYAAAAQWSLTFRWRTAQLVTRRGAAVLMLVVGLFVFDIGVWHFQKDLKEEPVCMPQATVFHWVN
ncbi:hypothetical protein [Dyella sp. C9]|uniref:hypothetical protein n=1 Tax=Dyella sp. C9 TaxID=2202154 RepID=UPI000DEFFF2D|nr:hypothetical protein [Dyella sp. C9]